MPNYKGGYSQLEEDLNANLNIGSVAEEKIFMKVKISCQGLAEGFEVMKEQSQTSDALMVALKKLANWNAGVQNYKNVNCFLMLIFHIKNARLAVINK
jgi:hypothetical protein